MFMWEFFGDKERLNMATDCEVNSYIPVLQKDPYCYPARFNLEDRKGSKYYYEHLPNQDDSSEIENHSTWNQFKDVSDAEKELISQQIDHMAKQTAEQVQRIAGTIPGEFAGYIDSLFKQKPSIFNWKSYFRRMLGTIRDVELKKTRKKESSRFPDASGLKHKKKASIFLVIDTSGSVSDSDLNDFFSEINHIWKAGTRVTICECDSKIQRVYEYTGKWDGSVSGRGGTVMYDAIEFFNQRRRDYQSIIFFTDGYVESDLIKIMGNAIWVITSDGDKSRQYPGKTLFIPKQ